MDYKLKAISNNVNNNDTIVDLIPKSGEKFDARNATQTNQNHTCQKTVPVLFATIRGVHLRKFNKSSTNNYSNSVCDLERWVSALNVEYAGNEKSNEFNFNLEFQKSHRLDRIDTAQHLVRPFSC